MDKRPLGNSGIEVAPLPFGGNVFGWTIDEQTSFELLDSFINAGFNLIDTADVYSRWKPGNKGGESETIIGNWIKKRGNRDQVVIATKVGGDMGLGRKSLERKYIVQAVDASLRRLQTGHIDLYQSHWDDLSTPVSESLEVYAKLIQQGKVRAIGASNFSRGRLAEAIAFSENNHLPRYETFQPRYNLYDRQEYEEQYQQLCVEKNLGVICYYSLASGFLTGKYRSENDLGKSIRGRGIKNYMTDRGFRILKVLDELEKKYNASPATISLAWLMSRPGIVAPIASATSREQLQELLDATDLTLDDASVQQLEEASA